LLIYSANGVYPTGAVCRIILHNRHDFIKTNFALDGKRPMVVFEQEYKAMQRYRRAYEKRKQRMLEVKKQEFENN
jgi:hypothetical protein